MVPDVVEVLSSCTTNSGWRSVSAPSAGTSATRSAWSRSRTSQRDPAGHLRPPAQPRSCQLPQPLRGTARSLPRGPGARLLRRFQLSGFRGELSVSRHQGSGPGGDQDGAHRSPSDVVWVSR